MDFESPRFAEDQLLLDILNDPDTGQLKFGPGSPAASVTTLQQAVWDLSWVAAVDPQIHNADFVIGTYGPITQRTVTKYKDHYGIHFPPDDPNGFVDAFAGPRTFRKLDGHCVNLDAGIGAILHKFFELADSGMAITLPTTDDPQAPMTKPVPGTQGTVRQVFLDDDDDGHIYFRRETGAFLLRGDLDQHYRDVEGGPAGPFGFPTADQVDAGDGTGFASFEGGTMTVDLTTGAVNAQPDGTTVDFGDPDRCF
ncbi:LGFP repeat-containing protein [Cumulibacter manganitolerans]|uniref:LGFP repeat-containing protein n=1 Tax=Cumulibacter manganitolerans TaxID=1884992 RepID=UPI001295EB34|nr:hypothetical protein [Cumulibacter manganitolerans]